MSTFIRAFALMLAVTGFSATMYNGKASSTSSSSSTHAAMGGGGLSGAPICMTPPGAACGLD